ncbi:hypothetical protein D7M11_09405 [Paenibacillus ginsengarvi]|uniref:Uncharacterized protein n=1 Tax=Paenibacillus ginsengarvi TaxID=400777 RepID=A0A3B0CJC2_9BACL|nr:hypothetical protein D7M11_09405 [Paenibacillus ginsengarvi]
MSYFMYSYSPVWIQVTIVLSLISYFLSPGVKSKNSGTDFPQVTGQGQKQLHNGSECSVNLEK